MINQQLLISNSELPIFRRVKKVKLCTHPRKKGQFGWVIVKSLNLHFVHLLWSLVSMSILASFSSFAQRSVLKEKLQ